MTNKLTQFTTHSSLFTNFAFTLAETLIVMGIIGVVAALTLPNLNSSTGDKEKVVKVKKIYQNLTDALGRAEAVYGPVDEWFQNDTTITSQNTRFMSRMTEFMKISKDCSSDSSKCINIPSAFGNATNAVVLSDGTSIGLSEKGILSSSGYNLIGVDIDGINKGSSKGGKDMFYFKLDLANRTIFPVGQEHSDDGLNECVSEINYSCAYWVIKNGNMDYLKAAGNLKCPNGIQLSTTNTSCK